MTELGTNQNPHDKVTDQAIHAFIDKLQHNGILVVDVKEIPSMTTYFLSLNAGGKLFKFGDIVIQKVLQFPFNNIDIYGRRADNNMDPIWETRFPCGVSITSSASSRYGIDFLNYKMGRPLSILLKQTYNVIPEQEEDDCFAKFKEYVSTFSIHDMINRMISNCRDAADGTPLHKLGIPDSADEIACNPLAYINPATCGGNSYNVYDMYCNDILKTASMYAKSLLI